MSLAPRTRLGPYEIVAPLGAGGMGEVYRARDTALHRDVAIKVLPAAFAEDEERLARFRREAQLVASLNHPNVAAIHGLVEANGSLALALELVDGEDLGQKLLRGPIPAENALSIARQIADGLEAAHERGIVHRDLKPANVKLTKDGTVKILDFGLAKACEEGAAISGDVSDSPTISRAATASGPMTAAGVVLGTASYMSPEQARGLPLDKRSDIWSFGAVLYEMLAGRRLFAGGTLTDTLAAVLTKEPDWKALPKDTRPSVRRLLARCLERDPRRRLRDIGDARFELEDVREPEPSATDASRRAPLSRAAPWAVALAAVLAAIAVGVLALRRPSAREAPPVSHVDLSFPAGVEALGSRDAGFDISADGRVVAMVGVKDSVRQLFIRRLDRTETEEVPETVGANAVAFSSDGKSIVFVTGGLLVRYSLTDRHRKVVATGVAQMSGVAWGDAGIVCQRGGALLLVSESGGAERALTTLDAKRREVLHADPLVLPGRGVVLFTSLGTDRGSERIEAVTLDGRRSVLVDRATTPTWSPTGHLLFGRDGMVFAAPFDAATVKVTGEAVPVLAPGEVGTRLSGTLGLKLSASGTLLYMPSDFNVKRVMSVARDGSARALDLPTGRYASPRVSPDGKRLLLETATSVLETLDVAQGKRTRLTVPSIGTSWPTWSGDGARVVFRRFNAPFWVMADGSGKEGVLVTSTEPDGSPSSTIGDVPAGPGPDADSILVLRATRETSVDLYLVSISGAFPPRPLVATRAYEGGARFSPDGRFLLYGSNESGQLEIFVRPYPALDRAWQVSEGGGAQAIWSRTGREIFYRGGGRVVAVSFDASGNAPAIGKAVPLFADEEYAYGMGLTIPNYDVLPDGRFVLLRQNPHGDVLRAAINWTAELEDVLSKGGVR
jgi:eukaryotic-like serine/threonine-protein kinase